MCRYEVALLETRGVDYIIIQLFSYYALTNDCIGAELPFMVAISFERVDLHNQLRLSKLKSY